MIITNIIGFIDKDTVNSYIDSLDAPGGKISLETFKKFMEKMDRILVDDEGNSLGLDKLSQALDLSTLPNDVEGFEDE